jgi:multicomponent Na+:H+ antiporter subunit D
MPSAIWKHAPHRSRFFGFFSLCVTATVGVAMAGNLFTFFVFYELLTLATYPLVVHRGTEKALRAGHIYLAYTLGGGALLLVGTVWLYGLAGQVDFVHGGSLAALPPEAAGQLKIIFLLLIAGLGVKAALVPLHGWLPQGDGGAGTGLGAAARGGRGQGRRLRRRADRLRDLRCRIRSSLGVLDATGGDRRDRPSSGAACVRMFQDDLKRRLAYSTVSQVSYIVLGVALFGLVGPLAGSSIWCIRGS